jgi:DNA-repair protein complementing XP-A cells
MLKKNPHNTKWGDMKLYLKSQCKDRALLVFENEEKLEEKKEVKILNLHKTRQKTYEKKIQGLILYKIVNFSSVVRMNPYGLSSK